MMGVTHRATGLATGATVAAGVRVVAVPDASVPIEVVASLVGGMWLTLVAGRAALWPDFDHSRSTATLEYGFPSRILHRVVEWLSVECWELSATDKDRQAGSFRGHRGLTHFAITAVSVGIVCGVLVWRLTTRAPALSLGLTFGYVVGLVTHWAILFFEIGKRKGRRTRAEAYGLLLGCLVTALVFTQAPESAAVNLSLVSVVLGVGVGMAITLGMLAHDLGDSATYAGVPFWWPLKIDGQRYYPFRIRAKENLSRTTKDSPTEYRLRFWSRIVLAAAVLAWVPGIWSTLACLANVC